MEQIISMNWKEQLDNLRTEHENLLTLKNEAVYVNGVYERYKNPILTARAVPAQSPEPGNNDGGGRMDLQVYKPVSAGPYIARDPSL